MSDLPVMKARERELKNILFDNHNATNLDLYNINYSELQPHVFQSNSSFASYVESFQPNSSYATEIDEWSQLFEMMISWQDMLLVAVFCAFIVITIIGNTLVIMAVITTRRLKTVTNCFVMSLAVADLLVGIFVMPPAVAVHLKVPTSNQLEMLATRNKSDESATYQTWEDKEIKFDIPNLQNRYRNGEKVLATINHIEDSKGNPGDTGSMLATNLRIIWHSLVHKKFNLWSWQLGWVLCDIWISLDVLLCTASILSLCAISVDRYLAVTQPLTYSRKRRSKRLALVMILIVWTVALAITCPPMFGWYEPGRRDLNECRYNQNEGYVIFSAMGSFFIPMAVMIYVYARISCVVASRHDNMTDISIHNKKFKRYTSTQTEGYMEGDCSEQDTSPSQKRQSAARTLSNQTIAKELHEVVGLDEKDLITKSGSYELVASTLCTQSIKRQSSVTSKNSPSIEQHYSFSGLQRHSMRHHINTTTPYANDTYITRNVRVHHQKSLSNRISSLKKENKTTQTLSIVVGGFIACWLPFFINYLITPFLDEAHVSRTIAKVLTWLGWFNSAINPFIYAFYSVDFRAAFWRLTLKRIFRSSSKTRFPSNIGTMSIRR